MGLRERISGIGRAPKVFVQEVIGRVSFVGNLWNRVFVSHSVDQTQSDYAFWDRFQRGLEPSYKLGGLFAKPIVQHITNWSLGKSFVASTGDERTDEALTEFVQDHLYAIMGAMRTSKSLGDGYLVVNPDGTLTEVPPNQVEIRTDPLDFRQVVAVTITTKLDVATITDEYRRDGRTVTVKWNGQQMVEVSEFANPSGRIPVIHFANEKGVNELYGHSIYEPLLPLAAEYDDVLSNSLVGVKAMSNPKPVLEKVSDPKSEMAALATRVGSYTDEDGIVQPEYEIDLHGQDMIFTSGEFNMKAPSPFTGDSWRMLKNLFYLMLQHVNIPEWLWGGHVESSNASVDAQMPGFTMGIDATRMDLEGPVRDLLEIWLMVVSLFRPGIKTGMPLQIDWPQLTVEDREVRLKEIQYARGERLITAERTLTLLDLVEDPATEVAAAEVEAEADADAFDQSVDTEIQRLMSGGNAPAAPEIEDEAA